MTKAWHQQFKRTSKERRTDRDGIIHDSVEEMNRWHVLKLEEAQGIIHSLRRQVRYPLILDNGRSVKTPTGMTMAYTVDFEYFRDGIRVLEDWKGFLNRESWTRIAMFEAIYGVEVFVNKKKMLVKNPRKSRTVTFE